jgi:hypothetical protein
MHGLVTDDDPPTMKQVKSNTLHRALQRQQCSISQHQTESDEASWPSSDFGSMFKSIGSYATLK